MSASNDLKAQFESEYSRDEPEIMEADEIPPSACGISSC